MSGESPLDAAREGGPEALAGSKGSTDTLAFKMEQNAAVVKRRIGKMILAGDIGGTKTLLGLFRPDGTRPSRASFDAYPTLDYAGLPEIIESFLAAHATGAPIQLATFGVAGPIIDQAAEMTNVPWRVDAAELRARFGFRDVTLLNDLEAMGYSVPVLAASELKPLQAGDPGAEGNIALIAAGTGLGTSLLHRVDGRYVPIASEGGHTDFAGRTDREIELVQFLRARFGRAEVEHVLSGPGLVNLAEFTHANRRCPAFQEAADPPDLPAAVSRSALAGTCECCVEALDLFVAAYGAVAGNFALAAVTRGGVFLGGGIAPRILPALERGTFIEAFNAKEPMRPLLEAMPVQVILNREAGLLGAAVYAARQV
jgi:glucokinase